MSIAAMSVNAGRAGGAAVSTGVRKWGYKIPFTFLKLMTH